MANDDDWSSVLDDHPIFSLPKGLDGPDAHKKSLLELSQNTVRNFTHVDPAEDGPTPSGRRQVMVLKDADLILAAGREIRITSLGDARLNKSTTKSYKVSHDQLYLFLKKYSNLRKGPTHAEHPI
jgi:nucleoporin NUP82